MGQWTRDELEREFAAYQERGAEAGRPATGRRGPTSSPRTPSTSSTTTAASRGVRRSAAGSPRRWASSPAATCPSSRSAGTSSTRTGAGSCARCSTACSDPGDGSVHEAANITILHYAGDGRWSYEEDVYNPAHFADDGEGLAGRRTAVEARGGLLRLLEHAHARGRLVDRRSGVRRGRRASARPASPSPSTSSTSPSRAGGGASTRRGRRTASTASTTPPATCSSTSASSTSTASSTTQLVADLDVVAERVELDRRARHRGRACGRSGTPASASGSSATSA